MLKYIFIFLISILLSTKAIAGSSLTPEGCLFVAQSLESAATERDVGIKLETHLDVVEGNKNVDKEIKDLVNQELRKVHGVYKNISPEKVAIVFYKQCFAKRGNIKDLMDSEV